MTNNMNAAWGEFLTQFHWQIFATATFTHAKSFEYSRRAAKRWIAELGPNVYAFVGHENGNAGGRTHFHALLGGLFEAHGDEGGVRLRECLFERAEKLWTAEAVWHWGNNPARNGNILIQPYDPKEGAAWYVSKHSADADIIGELQTHRRHPIRRRVLQTFG